MAKKVFYRLYQDNRDESKYKGKWYARAKVVGSMGLEEIAEKMQENISMKKADAYAVLIEVVGILRDALLDSKRVKIDGLGTFSVGIKTEPAESASAFTASANIKRCKVNFLPDSYYPNGMGKGKARVYKLLDGISYAELPKNAVDTSKKP